MSMKIIVGVAMGIALLFPATAAAAPTTEQVVASTLRDLGSPLAGEAYTVVAFRRYHGPAFSMVDFYALLWAESSLGKGTLRHRNVASIRGGKVGTLWRDLRTGTFGNGYNHYQSVVMGSGQHYAWFLSDTGVRSSVPDCFVITAAGSPAM